MDNSENIYPERKSIRLKDFNYASTGAYFVTITTHDRRQIFGAISQVGVSLSEFGAIAREQWVKLPQRFHDVELDAFVVMPDHIHGIIFITDEPFAGTDGNLSQMNNILPGDGQPQGLPLRDRQTIGEIVGAYKSLVVRECLNIYKARNEVMGKLWQRNYYEHVIRDDEELNQVRLYIEGNPLMK